MHKSTLCNTHDLLDCSCDSENTPPYENDDAGDDPGDSDDEDDEWGFVVASTLDPKKMSKAVSIISDKREHPPDDVAGKETSETGTCLA